MNLTVKLLLISLASPVLLAACASPAALFSNAAPSEIFYKDGRAAYVATCRALNWGPCLEKAGMVCRNAGYTVLEKSSTRNYGEDEKEMVFSCNAKPDSGEAKPAS